MSTALRRPALTQRQREVLDSIEAFIASRRYSPSLEEIGAHCGMSSMGTVSKHVSNLERKGLIRRDWNRARSIEIVGDAPPPSLCDRCRQPITD